MHNLSSVTLHQNNNNYQQYNVLYTRVNGNIIFCSVFESYFDSYLVIEIKRGVSFATGASVKRVRSFLQIGGNGVIAGRPGKRRQRGLVVLVFVVVRGRVVVLVVVAAEQRVKDPPTARKS